MVATAIAEAAMGAVVVVAGAAHHVEMAHVATRAVPLTRCAPRSVASADPTAGDPRHCRAKAPG